jgi:hypothetical protein
MPCCGVSAQTITLISGLTCCATAQLFYTPNSTQPPAAAAAASSLLTTPHTVTRLCGWLAALVATRLVPSNSVEIPQELQYACGVPAAKPHNITLTQAGRHHNHIDPPVVGMLALHPTGVGDYEGLDEEGEEAEPEDSSDSDYGGPSRRKGKQTRKAAARRPAHAAAAAAHKPPAGRAAGSKRAAPGARKVGGC